MPLQALCVISLLGCVTITAALQWDGLSASVNELLRESPLLDKSHLCFFCLMSLTFH